MSNDLYGFMPRFSFFNRPITNLVPSMEYTLLDAYHYITEGAAALATEQCRSLPPDQRNAFKKSHFDYCTFSGIFDLRRAKHLKRHSMIICFDLDHLHDVEATFRLLLDDKYFETLLLFRSPSGDGLKWVISMEKNYTCREQFFSEQTPAQYHPMFFDAVKLYLVSHLQLYADAKCKDVARACYLPHDPNAFINPALL